MQRQQPAAGELPEQSQAAERPAEPVPVGRQGAVHHQQEAKRGRLQDTGHQVQLPPPFKSLRALNGGDPPVP